MKINIIGIGRLGSTLAYAIIKDLDVVYLRLVDIKDLTGDLLDLRHARDILNKPTPRIGVGPIRDPDITIICAGLARHPDKKPMHAIYSRNRIMIEEILNDNSFPYNHNIILLTNPSRRLCGWASKNWKEYKFHHIESILERNRGNDTGWDIVCGGKGYSNFGPVEATIVKIKELLYDNKGFN